jgi:hypothetical protein
MRRTNAVGVPPEDVEEGCLGHVVEVVGGGEAVCADLLGGGVEGSAAEDSAVGACVELSLGCSDLVHGAPVYVLEGGDAVFDA